MGRVQGLLVTAAEAEAATMEAVLAVTPTEPAQQAVEAVRAMLAVRESAIRLIPKEQELASPTALIRTMSRASELVLPLKVT